MVFVNSSSLLKSRHNRAKGPYLMHQPKGPCLPTWLTLQQWLTRATTQWQSYLIIGGQSLALGRHTGSAEAAHRGKPCKQHLACPPAPPKCSNPSKMAYGMVGVVHGATIINPTPGESFAWVRHCHHCLSHWTPPNGALFQASAATQGTE